MNIFPKLNFLLSPTQIRKLIFLMVLIFIGALFEMAGLGLIIPVVLTIMDPLFIDEHPQIRDVIGVVVDPSYNNIVLYSIIMLVLFYVFKTLYLLCLAYKQGMIVYEIKESVSRRLFVGYMNRPYSFYLTQNSAKFIRNLTTEIGYFTIVLRASIVLIVDGLVLLGLLGLLLYVEFLGTIVVSIVMGVSAIFFQYLTKDHLLSKGLARQHHEGLRIQHIQQGISSIKDVRVLGREKEFINQFNTHNVGGIKAERFQYILAGLPRLWLEFVVMIGLATIIFILISSGKDSKSISLVLGVYAVAIFRMLPSVNRLLGAVQQLRYCWSSVDVVTEELRLIVSDEAYIHNDKTDHAEKITLRKKLAIHKMFFRYQGSEKDNLVGINAVVPVGKCVGIIGESGAGKSTLVDIILGLLKPTQGKVLVDNIDIHQNPSAWCANIGYVSQHIYLTDDTLKRNIAFGLPNEKIDTGLVEKAICAAQLDQVVKGLPEGIETIVGEKGIRLSGGQCQRIAIARALYHNPGILILDEATSALDPATEIEIMQTIKELQGDKTIIIISHRLSTLENCDVIYRMKQGKIISSGTYEHIIG